MLSVIMLNFVMLNGIMLTVMVLADIHKRASLVMYENNYDRKSFYVTGSGNQRVMMIPTV